MEKRTKIYALILLVLCLVVPAVNAIDITVPFSYSTNTYTFDLETINDLSVTFVSGRSDMGLIVYGFSSGSLDGRTLTLDPSENSVSGAFRYWLLGNNPSAIETSGYIIVNYNYVSPTPEPTPLPTAPYITATVYNTGPNNLFYDYNVRCMPASGYFFAPLSFYSYGGQLPQCDLTSEETSIQVRVWAGEDIPMYSCALSGSGGAPNFQYIQTVLSAPVYTGADVVNNQTVHEELQNMPNPVKPSGSSGGIVSGAWQPLALKQNLTSINTPFSNIVDNYLHYFHFPVMATPETVKAELLNGTGNLTAPLYDSVDGLTSIFMILPNYVSGVLTGLISPISETVLLIKDIIYTLSDYVYNAMSVLYVFIPFIYLFIPDVIWWGLTIYLSYLVFAWLLTLLFGYDVISVFYVDPFVSWVRNRRGGE